MRKKFAFSVVVKSRKKGNKQLYKCYACGHQFVEKTSPDVEELWHLYRNGKQTYLQLAERFGCSTKTI
jgi:transposase-like protein